MDHREKSGPHRGGTTVEERANERRQQLLTAAYDLLDDDEPAVTVRAVLRASGLNPRYFYESFVDLDDLLGALHDQQMALLAARVEADLAHDTATRPPPAGVIRTGIESVLRHLTEDPRRARVLISGWPDSATLGRRRRRGFLDQIRAYSSDDRLLGAAAGDPDRRAVFATMFAGSMGSLAAAWADGRLGDDLDAVVDRSVELAVALYQAATKDLPDE